MPNPVALDYNLIKSNFTAGELSPRLAGRVDLDKYYQGCDTLENWLIYPQGGVYRRPGMRYVCSVKTANQGAHLVPFRFSSIQNYVIELGQVYARFYRNGGRIEVTGTPVEIVTPFAYTDTNLIKWCQSADTLYLAHNTYHPQKITRTSDTVWSITRIDFLDGPYLDANLVSTALLTPSATANTVSPNPITNIVDNGSGICKITCVAHGLVTNDWVKITRVLGTTEANGYFQITKIDNDTFQIPAAFVHAYTSGGSVAHLITVTSSGTNADGTAFAAFVASDTAGSVGADGQLPSHGVGSVGQSWRYSSGGTNYGWFVVIKTIGGLGPGSPITQVIADVRTTLDGTGSVSTWKEGAWSFTHGFPACCTIKDQRLIFANSTNEPQKMWASRVNDYENFIPQFTTGTTVDSDAWAYKLGTQQVNPIQWLTDSSRGLLVGTTGEEHIGSGSGGTGPITPTSVYFRVQTSYGSINTALPVRVGYETLFVTRTGFKIRAAAYNLLQDVYIAPDRTIFSEHISWLNSTSPGFAHMAYALEPNSDVWLSRNDGQICVLTYVPEQNIAGWSRQVSEDGDAKIESLVSIPSTNLNTDTIWCVVNRTVNGSTARYVEYFDPSVNTDAAITVDNTQAVSITLASTQPQVSCVVTAASPVFSAGNVGQEIVCLPKPSGEYYPIPGSLVPIIPGPIPANQTGGTGRATITGFNDTTHVVVTITEEFANATVSGGNWGFGSFSFTQATHLIGKTVNVIGDGAVYPDCVVDGTGKVTLPAGSSSIVAAEIGLQYTATLTTVRPDPKAGTETIQTDRKRWEKIKVRVQSSTGLFIGPTEITSRDFTMAAGVPPGPFTGDLLLPNATTYDFDGRITITQPYPVFTAIHSIFGRLDTGPI